MRTRTIGGLLTALLLLLLPGSASAQDLDPCYVDPLAPECVEVIDREVVPGDETGIGGAELCVDPVTGALIDLVTGEVVAGTPAPGTPLCGESAEEVDVEVLALVQSRPASAALAVTGSDLAIGLFGIGMLGLGTLFVVSARRRRTGGV